jgi:hypothetical protein
MFGLMDYAMFLLGILGNKADKVPVLKRGVVTYITKGEKEKKKEDEEEGRTR